MEKIYESEDESGEHIRPVIRHQFRKPRDGKGFTWQGVHEDQYNPKRRTGWMKVIRFNKSNPPENFPPGLDTTQLPMPGVLPGSGDKKK